MSDEFRERYNQAVTLRNIAHRIGDEQRTIEMEKVVELLVVLCEAAFEQSLRHALILCSPADRALMM